MKKNIILTFLSILCISSCTFPFMTTRSFKLKYDGKNTGLDKRIEMNGVYYSPEILRYNTISDSIYKSSDTGDALLFYSDGIYINTLTDNPLDNFSHDKSTYNIVGGFWGRYILKGDTIIGQRLNMSRTEGTVYTDKLIIVNSTQIRTIGSELTYTFIPLENRMDSANWMFEKKWFYKKGVGKNK